MHPMNPVLSGLLNGLSVGNMIRRSALEKEQMDRQKLREQRQSEIQDMELASEMAARGIRPTSTEDIVNKMTGTVQATAPGRSGGSTGKFSPDAAPEAQPDNWEEKDAATRPQVPTLSADIAPGTMPQMLDVPDDNRYVKFRGQDFVIPGQRERAASADAAERRKLRITAEEKQRDRETNGIEITPEMQEKLGIKGPPGKSIFATHQEANDFMTHAGQMQNIQGQVEERAQRVHEREQKQQLITNARGSLGSLIGSLNVDDQTKQILNSAVNSHLEAGDLASAAKVLPDWANGQAVQKRQESLVDYKNAHPVPATGSKSEVDEALNVAAKSLADGDLTRLRDIASLRGDQRIVVYARAKKLNPNFNPAETDRKIKMEDYYINGKGANNLQSFNTFLEHAGAASESVDSIRLTNSKLANKPLNWWRDNMSGSPEYTNLIGSLEPVRKEFEGFLLGGRALYGEDRKSAEAILSDNSSPDQIKAALTRMGHTAEARLTEENYRYKKQMGKDLVNPLSPEAAQGAKKLGLGGGKVGGGGATAISITAPNGKTYRFPDQKSADAFKKAAGMQ